jgi:hypothetical protein
MKLIKYPTLFVSLLLALNVCAQKPVILTSDKPGWHRIGELTMNLKNDTSFIEVIGADAFSAIRLKGLEGEVGLAEMIVHFEEGPDQVISFYRTLKPDEQIAAIPLKGGEKPLRRISLVGKTMPEGVEEKAQVRLMGFKSPNAKK